MELCGLTSMWSLPKQFKLKRTSDWDPSWPNSPEKKGIITVTDIDLGAFATNDSYHGVMPIW